jgi:hypothetical protein
MCSCILEEFLITKFCKTELKSTQISKTENKNGKGLEQKKGGLPGQSLLMRVDDYPVGNPKRKV